MNQWFVRMVGERHIDKVDLDTICGPYKFKDNCLQHSKELLGGGGGGVRGTLKKESMCPFIRSLFQSKNRRECCYSKTPAAPSSLSNALL